MDAPATDFSYSTLSAGADVVTRESEMGKKIQFNAFEINDDGTVIKLEPFGVNGNNHPLVRNADGQLPTEDKRPQRKKVATNPSSIIAPVPKPAPTESSVTLLPPIPEPINWGQKIATPQPQSKNEDLVHVQAQAPVPQLSVEIISEAIDIPVPCFEIHLDNESGFLTLIVPRYIKFKFTAGKTCKIRVEHSILHCWYIGLKVLLQMAEADMLVFAINNSESDE